MAVTLPSDWWAYYKPCPLCKGPRYISNIGYIALHYAGGMAFCPGDGKKQIDPDTVILSAPTESYTTITKE